MEMPSYYDWSMVGIDSIRYSKRNGSKQLECISSWFNSCVQTGHKIHSCKQQIREKNSQVSSKRPKPIRLSMVTTMFYHRTIIIRFPVN